MKLLTKGIRAKLPQLYTQDNEPDPTVWLKLFCPWNNWTWLATEGSGDAYAQLGGEDIKDVSKDIVETLCQLWQCTLAQFLPFTTQGGVLVGPPGAVYTLEDFRFFGYVHGLEDELGYFSLKELRALHGRGWQKALGIERDINFTPAPLSEVLARYAKTSGWTPTWTPREEDPSDG